MNSETLEAMEVVDTLNDKWVDMLTVDEYYSEPFTFVYGTEWKCIKFFDETMWDNLDYGCEYLNRFEDDEEELESIYTCVVRRVKEHLNLIKRFEL